jgi:hypothetical protein
VRVVVIVSVSVSVSVATTSVPTTTTRAAATATSATATGGLVKVQQVGASVGNLGLGHNHSLGQTGATRRECRQSTGSAEGSPNLSQATDPVAAPYPT